MLSIFKNALAPLMICAFLVTACGGEHQEQADTVATRQNAAVAPTRAGAFVPPGYRILSRAKGVLNDDVFEDVVLVLAEIEEVRPPSDEGGLYQGEKPLRPLLLLLRQANGALKLAARNDHAIMCFYCGGRMGDAFEDVWIDQGKLVISHSGGSGMRWASEVEFKYDAARGDWLLEEVSVSTFNAFGPEDEGVTTETQTPEDFGVVTFSNFNVYDATEF